MNTQGESWQRLSIMHEVRESPPRHDMYTQCCDEEAAREWSVGLFGANQINRQPPSFAEPLLAFDVTECCGGWTLPDNGGGLPTTY